MGKGDTGLRGGTRRVNEMRSNVENAPISGTFIIFEAFMRIIATSTLKNYMSEYPDAVVALSAWLQEVERAAWMNPQELKKQFGHASVVTGKRIVFNVGGNNFRLVVDIEFRLQLIFIVWFGSHKDYDKIDVKKICYVKTDKK